MVASLAYEPRAEMLAMVIQMDHDKSNSLALLNMKSMILALLIMGNTASANGRLESSTTISVGEATAETVDSILKRLCQKTSELKTYQCQIQYLVSQTVLEAETLSKGTLYCQTTGRKSKLRVNFETIKRDDGREQKHVLQYIFDGVWLTVIDYQLEQVTKRQVAEPNEADDVWEFVGRYFPVIAFRKIEDLRRQFEMSLVEDSRIETDRFARLHLEVKPDSVYREDYISIELWIDKTVYLPHKIIAVSTEPEGAFEKDIYQISFQKHKVNKKLKKGVFELNVPRRFGKPEIIPLE